MSNLFGDFESEIPDGIKPQTNFWFKLSAADRKYGINQDDPKRNSVTLQWEIVDDGIEENQPFIGMKPGQVWIAYWDGLTKEEYMAFDDKSKDIWKMGRDNLKAVQRALGYTEEEIAEFTPGMFDEKLGTVIVGKCYRNRNGQDVFDMKTLVPLTLVQS